MTEEEARALITRLLGTPNQIAMHPFEFGWAAREILSEQERATPSTPERTAPAPPRGLGLGQGTFIIDKATGIVTVQTSLPVPILMEQYTEHRRKGRIYGLQVWPEPTEQGQTTMAPTSPDPDDTAPTAT